MPDDKSTATSMPVASAASPERSARLMRWASYASVAAASVMIAAKLVGWIATDSVSVLSTLIDSFLDVGASLVNLIAIHHALQPADREHRFGHGKAEPLAGLAQAAFIGGSAVFLVIEAGHRLFEPRELARTDIGIAVIVASIAITLVLVAFQMYVVRRTGSVAIRADSLHYRSDLLLNFGVLASLVVVRELGWTLVDPLLAVVIAGYILRGAWGIGRTALDHLMDHELPDEDRQRIRGIALAHPGVHDLHDLRTRASGTQLFIQLDLEMDGEISLNSAHAIATEVMERVANAYPNAEVFIHQDPRGVHEPHHGIG